MQTTSESKFMHSVKSQTSLPVEWYLYPFYVTIYGRISKEKSLSFQVLYIPPSFSLWLLVYDIEISFFYLNCFRTAQPVSFLKFSPDGTLFATAGKSDRLVKIWYSSKVGMCFIFLFLFLDILSFNLILFITLLKNLN